MRAYMRISGTLFGLVALVHVLRLFLGWRVDVAGWAVPIWMSGVASLITGALCIWAFRLAIQGSK